MRKGRTCGKEATAPHFHALRAAWITHFCFRALQRNRAYNRCIFAPPVDFTRTEALHHASEASSSTTANDFHADQPTLHAGARLVKAQALLILLHGHGSTFRDIMGLAGQVMPTNAEVAARLAFVAPQAAGNTWYPQRFVAPLAENEPWLTSALHAVASPHLRGGRHRGHSNRSHCVAGLFAGGLSGAGVRGALSPSLWRCGGAARAR